VWGLTSKSIELTVSVWFSLWRQLICVRGQGLGFGTQWTFSQCMICQHGETFDCTTPPHLLKKTCRVFFLFFSSLFVIKLNRVELVNCSHYWLQTLTIWLMWVPDKVLTKLGIYWHKQLQFKCSDKSIFNFLLLCALTGICELCSHLTKSMATCQDALEYSSNRHHSRLHCFVMSILIVDSHLQITARISQCQTLSSQIMLKLWGSTPEQLK